MIKKLFLVVDAEGETRLVKRASFIRPGEAAFELRVNIPRGWGAVIGSIDVTIPEPPTVTTGGAALVRSPESLAPTPPGELGS